ncbi:D(1) dopamine receptor [Pimephales promelas]|nr:D(1) dopamine receptor [Pimephales promelas]
MFIEMENGTNHTQDRAHGAQEQEDGDGQNSVRALLGFVLFLLIISTLLGNTLVCAAVVKFRHLRSKVTNFFVISLAVSDLFVAVLVMPWEAISAVAGTWLFGRFCGIWIAFDIMCSTASILNLCIISVDRYWAIASPFRYERKMTHRVAFMMIGVAWTLSILISFIPVQLNWHMADEGADFSFLRVPCVP